MPKIKLVGYRLYNSEKHFFENSFEKIQDEECPDEFYANVFYKQVEADNKTKVDESQSPNQSF